MFKVEDARANVIRYKQAIDIEIEKKVDDVLETMSKGIQFYSEKGLDSIVFTPYGKSRFSTGYALDYASKLITKELEKNGYTILENDCKKNLLRISWE